MKIMIMAILNMGSNVTPINFNVTKRNQGMRVKSHLYSMLKLCKSVKSFDANALHLLATMEKMPIGFYLRYREANEHRPAVFPTNA